ncbi:winged helix-turn-helix domain-containing protein [Pseudoalteromonas sp. T1lg88]|uniref:winged helix-turn-helix domain-containing protein n=1 Tax=Pseudoalteromonas sp. T1lg88 TaxID=2077104 RepID=UPI00131A1DD2|nr:response regulator transcription factor [Pseudoalteromonas sp. T1lg88]
MLAKLKAILRYDSDTLAQQQSQQQITLGKAVIDNQHKSVHVDNGELEIPEKEFELLWVFAQHKNQTLNREQLFSALVGREFDGLDRTVDVRISRLRKRLEASKKCGIKIRTVWGKGYMLVSR